MKTLQHPPSRQLAQVFSTRVIRDLSYQHRPLPLGRLQPLLDLVDDSVPLGDAFEAAYTLVRNAYRCEYVYKNTLVEGLTAADNAIIELPVQMSIADTVIINDTASAYEIKTDLDSFSRLDLQLFSYSSCFEHVNVVTSEARAHRATAEIPDHVGVLALTAAGELAVIRAARADFARLNQVAMFRVLRKDERLAILQRQLDYTIDAPPARLYQRMLTLFTTLPIGAAYREFTRELRGRDHRQRTTAQGLGLPPALHATIYATSLTPPAWRRVGAIMRRPASEFRTDSRQHLAHSPGH